MGKKKVAEQKPDVAANPAASPKSAGRRARRVESGRVYITSSYNNTVVTVTDHQGNVVTWASAGSIGFSGPKKATPFAASKIMAIVAEKLKDMGMTSLEVYVRGVGGGRDSALRSLANYGFTITSFKDATPIPHNGPRRAKVRRV